MRSIGVVPLTARAKLNEIFDDFPHQTRSLVKQKPFFVEVMKPPSLYQSTFAATSRMNKTNADSIWPGNSVSKTWITDQQQQLLF